MNFFTQLFNFPKGNRFLLVCVFYFLSITCFAASPYLRMYTSNCSSTSNSISFDLYIVNDSNTTVIWYWGQMQFTVDRSIFVNHNTTDACTVSYDSGTSELDYFETFNGYFRPYTYAYSYTASSRTIKLSIKWNGPTATLSEKLLYNTPVRIGRFTLTNNTENFASNASVNLNWNVNANSLFYFPSVNSSLFQLKQIAFSTDSTQKGYLSTPCSIIICSAPSLSASVSNTSGDGISDGAIDLTTSAGTSPFTYTWTKEGDAFFSASTEDISGLQAGIYHVTVITGGCSATGSYTITEASGLDTITSNPSFAATAQTVKNIQLQCYPNPSSSIIHIVFTCAEKTKYKLMLTDIAGRQIISKELNAQAGRNTLNFDISKYAGSIYMLSLISDKERKTIKVIKQ